MKRIERDKAIALRKKGYSVKEITRKLGVSKASVSVWVRNVVLTTEQRKFLSEKGVSVDLIERRRATRLKNETEKISKIMNEAGRDFTKISQKELKLIGIMLYWAEGRKRGRGTAGVSNSDPLVIKTMMRFFREICHVREERFRGQVHTHSHLNSKRAERYWSDISGVPIRQLYKTYSKPSIASKGKMDSLPYGTFDICVSDTRLFLQIMGWVQKIGQLISA